MTAVVPIPPDVWERMSRTAQDRARTRARRYLAYARAVEQVAADDVRAQARALQSLLPDEDPAACARRAAAAIDAVYGRTP